MGTHFALGTWFASGLLEFILEQKQFYGLGFGLLGAHCEFESWTDTAPAPHFVAEQNNSEARHMLLPQYIRSLFNLRLTPTSAWPKLRSWVSLSFIDQWNIPIIQSDYWKRHPGGKKVVPLFVAAISGELNWRFSKSPRRVWLFYFWYSQCRGFWVTFWQ